MEGPKVQVGRDDESFFIRDNGVGFDMAHAGKLFGAFERLHRGDEFGGTGIGFANVERIVRRHGGRVWADSAPVCGSTFRFTPPERNPEDEIETEAQTVAL